MMEIYRAHLWPPITLNISQLRFPSYPHFATAMVDLAQLCFTRTGSQWSQGGVLPQCMANNNLYRPIVFSWRVLIDTWREVWKMWPTKSSSICVEDAKGDKLSHPFRLSSSISKMISPSIWYFGCSFHLVKPRAYANRAHCLKTWATSVPDPIKMSRSPSVSHRAQWKRVRINLFPAEIMAWMSLK